MLSNEILIIKNVFLAVITLRLMSHKHFYLLFIFVSQAILLTGCEQQQPAVISGYKVEESRLAVLYEKAAQYGSANPDSLALIGQEVLKIGNEINDHLAIVRGEKIIARSLWNSANHSEAMRSAVKALRDAEKWQIKEEIPNLYGIIGNLHKEKANYNMAFDAAEKGLAVALQIRDTTSILFLGRLKAMFTQGLGADKRDAAMIRKSQNIHLSYLPLAESSAKFERARIPYYNNIAQVYVKRDLLDSAVYYADKAVSLAKKHNQLSSLTYSYTWLSQVAKRRGDMAGSIRYLDMAMKIAAELKHPFRQMELYKYMVTSFRDAGKYREALDAQTRYGTIRDSLQVLNNVRQVGELQIQYEAGKKDRQISELAEINSLRSKQTAGAMGGLGLVLILAFMMFKQYRIIRQKNLALAENNRKIGEQADKLQLMMKELHHRVKNNLQIVSNLLSLQGNRLVDEDARGIIKAGQQRIETMSIIHKSLYSQETMNVVNMRQYVTDLLESIMQSFGIERGETELRITVEVEELDVDIAMPLGLIINEWITNSFKHAFHHVKKPVITLKLIEMQGQMQLEMMDNGPGFDLKIWEHSKRSFGVRLIKVLAKQLEGHCRVIPGAGAFLQMEIPLNQDERAA
jgi:two-component sensor histidine kinase